MTDTVKAVLVEMRTTLETGSMPGVRMKTREKWADRIEEALETEARKLAVYGVADCPRCGLPTARIKLQKFYDKVKYLTDHAFILKLKKAGEIDFVNAEDLERLLEEYNPNPTEDDNASSEAPEAPLPDIEL